MTDIVLQKIDYEGLGKTQKLALFLTVVGAEAAAELLRNFDDGEIEGLCREMSNFTLIDQEAQERVVAEFSNIISESLGALPGGPEYTRRALELAKGDYKAANLLGRIAPVGNSVEIIQEISDMEPRQVYNLIRLEQPQTIAFVASHLSQDKAANLVSMLPPDTRDEVVERIGTMEATSLEHVNKVVSQLRRHIDSKYKPTMHRSGGVRVVADLLNLMPGEVSKTVLGKLEERNPNLGLKIRRKMFNFEDLIRLDRADLQRVTRELEMSDLVMAMKTANSALQEALYGSVSKRAAESLQEEMQMLGPVRLKDVESAQDRIIQVVRRLEEEGEISLEQSMGGGDDRVI